MTPGREHQTYSFAYLHIRESFWRDRRSRHLAAGALLASLLLATAAWALLRVEPHPAPSALRDDARIVRVAAVEWIQESSELRFPGTTRAARRAALSFAVPGRLIERGVDVGDAVEAQSALARLDPAPFRNEVRAAESARAEVQAKLDQLSRDQVRLAQLHERGVTARQRLETVSAAAQEARASLAVAQTRLQEARRRLSETTLAAPFAGHVTRVHLEPGEYAQAGAPVLSVSGSGGLELEVETPEAVAAGLVESQAVRVSFPLTGRPPIAARLVSVARGAEGPGRLFPVVAEFPFAPGLMAGMAAELVVRIDAGEQLAVPLAAIVDPNGMHPTLFRVRDDRAQRVEIEVRSLVGERVTVTGPLAAGDLVVVAGHGVLLDGDSVEVR